jgi:hypothetical protein
MFRERKKSFDNSMVQTSERKSCHLEGGITRTYVTDKRACPCGLR